MSTHAVASTDPSEGLHSMSSTLPPWPAYAPDAAHEPPSRGAHVWSLPRQSPDASAPTVCGDHASPKPSAACDIVCIGLTCSRRTAA